MSEPLDLDNAGEPHRFVSIRGTEYLLADQTSFGLRANAELGQVLRRMQRSDQAGSGGAYEKADLAELAIIAAPTAPLAILRELDLTELRDLCTSVRNDP
jgi:hypothetical protein